MLTRTSPAKINLFLKVVGRRPDGYHDLASLFQTIDLADTLHIALADEDELTSTSRYIPTDSSNLILKAAELFRQKTGKKFGVHVHLVKRIPHQAGLGGGSSNAATTLMALNELCGHPASCEDLMQWGGEIGSDVPFFFTNGTAYCTGRGEVVQELDPLPEQEVWIVKPDFGLSTPEVFNNLETFSNRDPETTLEQVLAGHIEPYNDLEPAAFKVAPILAEIKQELQSAGAKVAMTGSGSAFYCLGTEPPRIKGMEIVQSRFINRK